MLRPLPLILPPALLTQLVPACDDAPTEAGCLDTDGTEILLLDTSTEHVGWTAISPGDPGSCENNPELLR